MFWGDYHLELFKRACFKSLMWPRNVSALESRDWHILTKESHFEALNALFHNSPFKLKLYAMGEAVRVAGCGTVRQAQCDAGVVLLSGLRDQIAYSIQSKSKMLLCPPDTIFGDGTIPNLLELGRGPGTCVAVPHPRVLPKVLDEIEYLGATRGSLTNAQLVTMAFKHQHAAFEFAEMGHKNNNSYVGGIAYKKLENGLYSVQHRLPTPYLMDFDIGDFNWWWGVVSFGALDHTWPGARLIKQERLRVVGSSDACFIVEITDHDKNVPPIIETKSTQPEDAYWGDGPHHSINRMFDVIWRGE